jgi:hypothetical protein
MVLLAALSCAALLLPMPVAEAKPACCFTSDDGHYPCQFRGFGGDGSFEITAPGKPGFTLVMEGRGVAVGSISMFGVSRALPGRYSRSKKDPACWVNDTTKTRICAW